MVEETRASSYERVLRVLGAYLDQESPDKFRVIEVVDGFTVFLQHKGDSSAGQEANFPRPALEEQARELVKGRKLFGTRLTADWRLCEAGRQDFLRALGFELDNSSAEAILIDELEDGVAVTYSYLDPRRGYQWRKQIKVLGPDQVPQMIERAHGRRRKRGLLSR